MSSKFPMKQFLAYLLVSLLTSMALVGYMPTLLAVLLGYGIPAAIVIVVPVVRRWKEKNREH